MASNNSFTADPIVAGRRPQDLGNLLQTDRATFSIGGSISGTGDIDFYSFDVNYEEISEQSVHHATVVFDLDYADGLNRPDTSLAVFNSSGTLVLIGRDSNVAEDRPGPLAGSDIADLSRGTVGPGDPFIGPAELPEGSYRIAVTSNARIPSELLNNPQVRLEPVDSLIRIAEDHIGSFGGSVASDPVVPVLLNPNFAGTGANLWHVTSRRAGDAGHGINPSFDLSRSGASGGESFYFGSETTGRAASGSTGALVSNTFSLEDYSAADVPVLYFNYFVNNNAGSDALRVSVLAPNGTATLIASSNTADAGSPTVTQLQQTAASGWRQARLNLGAFANMSGLQLRFDYNAVSVAPSEGAYIDDVIIGFAERGEMVTGATSNPLFSSNPDASSNAVASGDYQLEIRKASEYGTSGAFATTVRGSTVWGIQPNTQQIVQIDPTTGAIVGRFPAPDALAPSNRIAGLSIAEGGNTLIYTNAHTNDNILYRLDPTTGAILSAENVPNGSSTGTFNRGGLGYDSGTIYLLNDGQGIETEAGFGGPVSSHYVISMAPPGAMGGDDQGRQFGVSAGGVIFEYDLTTPNTLINAFFAPSGQIEGMAFDGVNLYVSDAAGNLITLDPDTGVELRRVIVGGGELIGLGAAPFGNSSLGLTLNRSIDTNDRLAQQTTLIVPNGSEVIEGQTFTVSDSVNSVTFEYEDPEIGNGVSEPGRVEIRFKKIDPTSNPFNPTYIFLQDFEIAALIRDAINSPQVQTRFEIRAALSDGTVTGTASRDNKINLFGNAIVEQAPSFGIVRSLDGTPQTTNDANLLRDALLGSNVLAIGNATFTGGASSAGFFEGGDSLLGLGQGIVLSTGSVLVAEGPNLSDGSTGRASGHGDPRLDAAFGVTTQDASILEFQFEIAPASLANNMDDIALNFVFASEEYNEGISLLGNPSDVLAIFVDGVNIGSNFDISNNIAVVPVNAVNQPVSINTINGGNPFDSSGATGVNSALFRNNERSNGGKYLTEFGFDGFTVRLTARINDLGAGPHTVMIAIADVNDQAGDSAVFLDGNSLIAYDATLDPTMTFERDPSGIPSVRHDGSGDQNRLRDQGQVLIHSNSITDSADFAITTESGLRDSIESSLVNGLPVPRLQSNVGPTLRLLELNDLQNAGLIGGFTPGVIIENNTISGEGLGGVHVAGNLTPLELTIWPTNAEGLGWASGDAYCDGDVFSLTVGRQSVVFEFEDIAGSPTEDRTRPCWIGSGTAGGNGWTTGRIPIFYRRTVPTISGYSPIEMARAIKEAIDNGPLVENQTTFVSKAYVTTTRAPLQDGLDEVAVYVENIEHFDESHHITIPSIFETQRFMPIGYAAQPFVKVVNNTIYGNDGNASFFPEAPVEPNDTLVNAADTRQGRAHNPVSYTATSFIGDSQNFRSDPSQDVDFFQFQMDVNDRVTITVDSGNSVDTVLRLFDATGQEVAINDNTAVGLIDPSIDFTATLGGTYYVAVSGVGNTGYSAISLADRQPSAARGSYTINVNVQAPRQFLVDLKDLLGSGAALNITDLTQSTFQIASAGGGNTAIAARNLVGAINGSGLTGVRASTIGARTWNYHLRDLQYKEYERYVVIEGAVNIVGVGSTVAELIPTVNTNEDQLLRETGILITEAATPTLMNNVLANLRNGVVETAAYRDNNDLFHHRDAATHPLTRGMTNQLNTHPLTTVKLGLLFQNNSFGNQGVSLPPNSFGKGSNVGGPSTGIRSGQMLNLVESYDPLIDTSDFNIPIGPTLPLFVNAPDGQFFPAPFALSIDSSVDSVPERSEFQAILGAAEIPLSPVLAPDTDGAGQLRVDDTDVDTPQGVGGNVFKDRGSLDRADFVGPAATLINPRDNDSQGADVDPALTVVQLQSGTLSSFAIQIRDGFEVADPFAGIGVDQTTLDGRIVPVVEEGLELNLRGPAVTVFEDGRFLLEGYDYTYRFDRTSNTILLSPLAGIWPNDKVYVITVNNRDRFVIDAKGGRDIDDGSSFKITNDTGETAAFEFDKGFSLTVAKTLGLQVPFVGASASGIVDGQRFTINDGSQQVGSPVVFEFDQNNNWPSSVRRVSYPPNATADQIADAIVNALAVAHLPAVNAQGMPLAVQPGRLTTPLSPRNLGGGLVHVGATDAHLVDVASSALTSTVAKTVLRVPAGPQVGIPAVADRQTFTVSHLGQNTVFEFERVSRLGAAITNTTATQLTVLDGNAFPPAAPFDIRIGTEEMQVTTILAPGNYIVTRGVNGTTAATHQNSAFVTNIAVPANAIFFQATDTPETIATTVANALSNPLSNGTSLGLTAFHVGSGVIELSGVTDHTFNVSNSGLVSNVGQVITGITVPPGGGADIADNEIFTVSNGAQTIIFELSNNGLASTVPGSIVIPFSSFPPDSANTIANAIAGYLNTTVGTAGNTLGLEAISLGNGEIRIDAQPNHTIDVSRTVLTRQVSVGGVRDGEVITLRENNTAATIAFKFGPVNPALPCVPGAMSLTTICSFNASDTHLDIAARLTKAIAAAGVGLTPVDAGGGEVNVGGLPGVHLVSTSQPSSFVLDGQPGVSASTTLVFPSLPGIQVSIEGEPAFADHDTFTISNGFVTAVFEFDKDGVVDDLNGDLLPDNIVITLNAGDPQDVVVTAIQQALVTANARFNLGITPVNRGGGVIALNADVDVVFSTAGLTKQNLLAGLTDGETFTVSNGVSTVTFEFENINPVFGTPNGVTGANVAIDFANGGLVDTVSLATLTALANANLGLNPFLPQPGSGKVELGDTTRHLTDVANTQVKREGFAGGATAVNIKTTFTESQVAAAIVTGINAAAGRIDGVRASLRGGSTVFVDISNAGGQPANFTGASIPVNTGYASIDGIDNFFLSAVKDLAGNSLKGNQATNDTVFTVLLPGVQLDFGDAPDPFAGPGRYPTLFESNGARHVLSSNGLFLGSGIDAERDGQPTLAADGDNSDHTIQLLDSKLSLLGLAPFSVQVPAAGGAGLQPNETFTIQRGGRPSVTFTFVLGVAANPTQIGYAVTDTASDIADKIVAAIVGQQASLALRPSNLGNGLVSIGGTPALSIGEANSSLTLTSEPLRQLILPLRLVVSDAASISDGAQFVVTNGTGSTITFEFDKMGGLSSGSVAGINLTGAVTAGDVASRVITAITTAFAELSAQATDGTITFSGIGVGHTIDATNAPTLAVNRSLVAKDKFSINDGSHPTVVFEVSINGSPVSAGSVAISLASGATNAAATAAILSAVQSQQFRLNGLSPLIANDHTVTLAFHRSDTLNLSTSSLTHANRAPASLLATGAGLAMEIPSIARLLLPANGGAGISDGDFFTIDDGINPLLRFEFDNNGVFSGIRLSLNGNSTRQELTTIVFDALQAEVAAGRLSGVTLPAVAPTNGLIDLQPVARVRVDTAGTGGRVQQQTPISDGDAFTIVDQVPGHAPVTFEFDLSGNGVTAGRRAINLSLGDSTNDIANKVAAAIKSATLPPAVLGSPTKPIVPVTLGNGIVDLSSSSDLLITRIGTPQFVITGAAGGISDGQHFTVSDGNQTWTFEFDRNDKFVEGRIQIKFASGVDRNKIGELISQAISNAIPTLAASDLGDGTILLQAADEDGVRFNGILVPGQTTTLTVTASGTGFLDAWFDFNRDGDWTDPGEQVLQNAPVKAGENTLSVTVPQVLPSSSPLGDTYARFRVSSAGNLLPTGLAVDGEVEDYKVRVVNNSAPVAIPTFLPDFTTPEDGPDYTIRLLNLNNLISDPNDPKAFNDANLTDGNGDSLTYSVGTRVLTIQQTGTTLRDGDTITIFAANNAISRTFEFDRDGIVTSGNIAVPYTTGATAAATAANQAASLASRITAQRYGITTSVNGTNIVLTGEGTVVLGPVVAGITVGGGLSVEVLQNGATLEDGGTITIVDAITLATRTFEFDDDGLTAAGNLPVPFVSTATRADLARSLMTAINRIADDTAQNYRVSAAVNSTNPNVVRLGGQSEISFGSVFDGATETRDDTLRVQTAGLNFLEAGKVTITPTQGVPQTFEFTTDGVFGVGNIPVVYDATRTQEQIAGIFAQTITNALFGVVAAVDPLEPTLIRLSGNSSTSLSTGFTDILRGTANGLQLRENGAVLPDNATVTIATADGLASRTFEFDSNGSVGQGNFPVAFDSSSTTSEIMGRLAAQIAVANYGVVATTDPLDGAILRLSGSGAIAFGVGFDDVRLVSDEPILLPSIDIDGETLRLAYQPDQNGVVNVTVRATDQGGLFAERTFQVVVAPGNDAPIAEGILSAALVTPSTACQVTIGDLVLGDGFAETINLCEDHAITVTLRGTDGDPLPLERQQLTFENFDQSNANGMITSITSDTGDIETGRFVFTPNVNFNGVGTIVFTVRDDGSAGAPFQQESPRFTLTLNVAAVNDPPTGANQVGIGAVSTIEDTAVQITLTGDDDGNATTSEGQSLIFTIASFPAHGTFTSGVDVDGSITGVIGRVTSATGMVTYRPNLNFNNNANSPVGPDSFTFNVSDNGTVPETSTAPATVAINVSAVNDTPIPQVVAATTTTSTVCVPLPGTLMLGTDLTQSVATCEDHVTTLTLGGSTGDDESAQTMTFTVVSGPTHGVLGAITPIVGSATQATVDYTPTAGFNGTDTFVIRARDNGLTNGLSAPLEDELTVTMTVQPVNAAPIAYNQVTSTPEDTAKSIALTADDGDPGVNQVLRYFVLAGADGSIVRTARGTLSGINPSTGEVIGQLLYTPDPNVNGPDSFTFQVIDDALAGNPPNRVSNIAIVDISVTPVNDPPVANTQSVVTNEDAAIDIVLTGNDGDPGEPVPQTLSYEIAVTPARGTLDTTGIGTGLIRYTPSANFNGTDTFTFRVRDNGTNPDNLLSTSATVTVTVNPLNDAPQFTIGQPLSVLEDSGAQTVIAWTSGIRPGPVSASDEAGQLVSFTTTNDNAALFLASGQPSVSSSGTLTFTPAPNAVGHAVLTLVAKDNGSGISPHVNTSLPQTVTITVNAVNDAPQFIKGPNQSTNEDGGLQTIPSWATNIAAGPVQAVDEANQELFFDVSYVTTGNLAFVPGSEPKVSTTLATLGQLSYQPMANTNGTATVTVTLRDGGLGTPPNVNLSPTETFTITVNPINDAPEFTPGADVPVNEDAGLVRISRWATGVRPGPAGATDESSQALTFVASTIGFTGGLTFTTAPFVEPLSGDLVFQTSPNKWGTATVTVRLRDSGAGTAPHINESAIHTLTISVAAVNDPPEFTLGANQQLTEDTVPQTVFGFVSSIRPGPASANDEASQSVTFVTTNNNNSLFAVQPAISATGTLTYSPAANKNGIAVVTVDARDSGPDTAPNVNSATKTFTITLTPVNDAPTLTIPGALTVAEDVAVAINGIVAADIDVLEGTGQVQLTFRATNGTLILNTNIPGGVLASQVTDNGSSAVSVLAPLAQINTTLAHLNSQAQADGLTYRGKPDFNGPDQIVIKVDDLGNTGSPGVLTVTRTVPITVTAVNDPPVLANPIADITVDEDAPVTIVELFPQVFNDPDVLSNNDRLTLRVVGNSNPLVASTIVNGTTLVITPVADASGETLITIEASDVSGEFVQDTFRFTVLAVNDPPTVVNDSFTVPGSRATVLNVLANDSDKDSVINPASVAIVSAPSGGSVVANGDGTITFTPNVNFRGPTTFKYSVSDAQGTTSQPATVTVTVNSPPITNADAVSTKQGIPVAISVLANDSDPDGTIINTTVAITQQPVNGALSVSSTGVVTYSPNLAFSGTDTFRYTVNDDIGGVSAPATVTITVTPFRPWQNPADQVANGANGALDVSADGFVSAIDVLLIINRINIQGSGPLPPPTAGNSPPPYFDVNGDGQITPIDALLLINFLNNGGSNQAEGEAVSTQTVVLAMTDGAGAASMLVSEFTPGYRQSRYSASTAMPPILYDEFVGNALVSREKATDLLVESTSDRYRDEIHSSQEDAYRLGTDLDDVLTDLVWDHAGTNELSDQDRIADAALTDLLEQDFFSR